jgi:hypothetical protein
LLIGFGAWYSPIVFVVFSRSKRFAKVGSILACRPGISRQALRPETLVVFLELRIGVAVRYRLPRPDWILRLSVCFIRDLLLGGALLFGHCSIPAPAICPELFKWEQ